MQGRFTSIDPIYTVIAERIVDPQQLNLYVYVRNNPLAYTDPTGTKIDTGRLSEEDKKRWDEVVKIANQQDENGDYVNIGLHDQYDRLNKDERTFFIENKDLGETTTGLFEVTKFKEGNQDFSEATIYLNFKLIRERDRPSASTEIPGFNKFEGLFGDNGAALRLAEVFGHEASHAEYALRNPAEAVKLQILIRETQVATDAFRALQKHNRKLKPPPDLVAKWATKDKALADTELFAQRKEQIINQELSSKNVRCKKK